MRGIAGSLISESSDDEGEDKDDGFKHETRSLRLPWLCCCHVYMFVRRLLLHGVGEWVSRQRPGHAERESGSPVEYRSTQFDIHLRQSRLSVYVTIK